MIPTYPDMQCTVLDAAILEVADENGVSWGDLSHKVPVKAVTRIAGEQLSCVVLIRKDLLADKGTSPIDEARPLLTEAIEDWIAEHR